MTLSTSSTTINFGIVLVFALTSHVIMSFTFKKIIDNRKKKKREKLRESLRTPLDYEKAALTEFAEPFAKYYYGYTSGQGETFNNARSYFNQIKLVSRCLTGNFIPNTSVNYFGKQSNIPVIIAPTAMHHLATPDGEKATSMGASEANVTYSYNYFLASKTIDEIAKNEDGGPKWLHLYIYKERGMVEYAVKEVIEKYSKVFSACIVTCDHPHNRVRDTMLPYFKEYYSSKKSQIFNEPIFPNACRSGGLTGDLTLLDLFEGASIPGTNDNNLSHDDLKWLVSLCNNNENNTEKTDGFRLPVIAKGIVCVEDALRVIECGVSGIVISNHGGRQIDGIVEANRVLRDIALVVKKLHPHIKIFCDTGVRTSTDILKLIALGADGVLMGRPVLWALSVGGSEALSTMFKQLENDMKDDMKCLGWKDINSPPTGVLYIANNEGTSAEEFNYFNSSY